MSGEAARFVWTSSTSAYERACEAEGPGAIPILEPADRERAARFRRVLARSMTAPRGGRGDWIVGLGEDARAPAEAAARLSGRPIAHVRDVTGVRAALRSRRVASVLVIGKADRFTDEALSILARSAGAPWGVVTAIDLPGLSFAVAKLVCAPAARIERDASIDAIDRRVRTIREGLRAPSEQFLSPRRVERALAAAWDRLVIEGHGEGAHMNLGAAVLCGAIGASPGSDCSRDADGARCKRAGGAPVHGFVDLRAREVLLLSCTSFSVAGQLLPSRVSAVLALVEGHARTVLCTREPIPGLPGLGDLLLALRRRGAGWGWIAQTANAIWKQRRGSDPFVLVGDPCGPAIASTSLGASARDGDGALARRVRGPVAVLHGAAQAGPIVTVRAPQGAAVLRAGDAILIARLPRRASRVVVAPARAILRARAAEASSLVARAAAARRLLASAWRFWDELPRAADLEGRVHDLGAQLAVIERAVAADLRGIEEARTAGVLDASAEDEDERRATRENIRAFDFRLAHLFKDVLFQFGYDRILTDGLVRARSIAAGPCARCGATRRTTIWRDPVRQVPDREQLDCPVCGYLAGHARGGARVHIIAPRALRPGRFRFSVRAPRVEAFGAIELRDKGRGERLVSRVEACSGRLDVDADVPASLTPDLHTITVAWVSRMEVAIARLRRPGRA